MYSGLYEEVPDLDKYLQRIGCERGRLNREYLDELIRCHQSTVPFENLSITLLHEQVSLNTRALFQKIVEKHRGGFCFELNGLFHYLLLQSGFHVIPCKARVALDHIYGNHVSPENHRIEVVQLNNKFYFCDVGFGGPAPYGSLLLEDGHEEVTGGMNFRFDLDSNDWWTQSYEAENGWEPIMQFRLQEVDQVDFVPVNYFYAHSDESKFTKDVIVNLRSSQGFISLQGNSMTEMVHGSVTKKIINSKEELQLVLSQKFGLNLKS